MKRFFRRAKVAQQPQASVLSVEEQARMSFFAHLAELRNRFFWAFGALVIGTILGFFVAGQGLEFLRQPYCQVVNEPADCRLIILGPTGGVIAYFRIALLIGAGLAIPMITYQAMMFVLPGMKRGERRTVLLSLPAITLLFGAGAAFAWYILMPPALGFLQSFQPLLFQPEWTADLYLSFVTALVFWMGVAFEMPLIFFVLALLGLVTPRLLISNWRIAIVGASIAAALITPTIDPVNMFLVMGPLLGLYVSSIFTVWLGRRFSSVESAP
jgi:sec-independent protein translocase protein TatC